MYESHFFKKQLARGRVFLFTGLLCAMAMSFSYAQDSTRKTAPQAVKPTLKVQDTIKTVKKKKRVNSPRKALLYSAVFPGFGQIYNRKYWKLIIIYGSGALIGWNMKVQHDRFLFFRNEFVRKSADKDYKAFLGLDVQGLRSVKNQAKRDRDFMIILSVLVYGLQMVDAHVDAHLMDFDLDENLSLRVKPTMESTPFSNFAGIGLSLRFK